MTMMTSMATGSTSLLASKHPAPPGGICLSSDVFRQVEGKVEFGFEDLGEMMFKNIAKPVRVYRLRLEPEMAGTLVEAKPAKPDYKLRIAVIATVTAVLVACSIVAWRNYVWPRLQERALAENAALPLPDKPSLAVLPFDNLTQAADEDYFSDGMTNSLITDLSQVSGLFVIARNTTFTYTRSSRQRAAGWSRAGSSLRPRRKCAKGSGERPN